MLGLGFATPALSLSQSTIEAKMADLWSLRGEDLARWRRIVAGSGIEKRHGVLPPGEVVHLSTAARMEMYERFAPALAHRAAQDAIERAGVSQSDITDLIVVSCTGFAAPGVDIELIERLGLPHNLRRTMIGFMGCFGAISGLRTAVGACAADQEAVALVVCVELCSLHMRADASLQNQVASALFADGAAAAVIAASDRVVAGNDASASEIGRVTQGASLVVPEGKEWMSWRVTDLGFAMTLTRDVPVALSRRLGAFVDDVCALRPRTFIVHPGGPGILDAARAAIGSGADAGIESSRAVLRDYGNMSSATVLFALAEALNRGCQLPAMMLAFGPGLTIESIQIL
jgi:predicted naringenin-chalcone synthase